MTADIHQQARQIWASEVLRDGRTTWANRILNGFEDNSFVLGAIRSALKSASDYKFRDPEHLAEWLGSLVSNDEEWDAAQAAMQGVRAFQNDTAVVERLQAAVEGECSGLAISHEQATAILHYVLQPLYYADETPPPKESE